MFPSTPRAVALHYDAAGNLTQRDTLTDSYCYQWDTMNCRLLASRQPNDVGLKMGLQANQVRFAYDRLLQWQSWQYQHDDYGNVISRHHHEQEKQTYQYDGDNRLVIAQTSGMKARYHYDALGRRIHKVVETREGGSPKRQETHFVWQGLRLLQEQNIHTGKIQTYCYEEHGSYTPLATIVKQNSLRQMVEGSGLVCIMGVYTD